MARQDLSFVRHFAALPDPRLDRTKKHSLLDIVAITLCATVAGADSFDEVAAFLHPEVLQEEYPNRLVARGKTRRLDGIRAAFEAGQNSVSTQKYEVRTLLSDGASVALEVDWEGTLAIPFGALKPGDVLRCASA